MSIDQMREAIAKVYDNPTWAYKVRRMPNNQVVAIYKSFQKTGRFDKKPATLRKGHKDIYRQMTIFDYV